MDERAIRFRDRAREDHGLALDVQEFPDGTGTAEEAADAIGCAVDRIASSLAFETEQGLVVVIASGATTVDEARLAAHCGVSPETVTLAEPERVRDLLGWQVGGVPPICHDVAVPTLLDEHLTEFDEVWAAAGTPSAVFPIDPDLLAEAASATVVGLAGAESEP